MLMRRSFAPTQRDSDSAVSAVLLPLSLAEQIAQLQKAGFPQSRRFACDSSSNSHSTLLSKSLSCRSRFPPVKEVRLCSSSNSHSALLSKFLCYKGSSASELPRSMEQGQACPSQPSLRRHPSELGARLLVHCRCSRSTKERRLPAQLLATQFMTPVKDTQGVHKPALPLQPQQLQFDMRSTLPIPSPSGGSEVISALQQQLELQQQLFPCTFLCLRIVDLAAYSLYQQQQLLQQQQLRVPFPGLVPPNSLMATPSPLFRS